MSIAKRVTKKPLTIYLFEFIRAFVKLGSILLACRSCTKSQLIYKLYAGYCILHMTIYVFYSLLSESRFNDFSMDALIRSLLYIAQMCAHLIILIESFFMDSKAQQIMKSFKEFDKRLYEELGATNDYCNLKVQSCISATLSVVTILGNTLLKVISFNIYQYPLSKTLLNFHSLLSSLALQFRILEMILAITVLNEYAVILCCKLDEMGERNMRRVFGHYLRGLPVLKGYIIRVMPRTLQSSEEDDEQQLRVYKKLYGDLYKMFKDINENYGWSVLAFMILYFIYFIVNSYWVILALITRRGEHVTLFKNLGFLLIVVTQLWILCWQCQNSELQSRKIGCIMFKLVKPKCKRSYNNLITDFSLQTLHQQYIITAKQFFNLNLNLLGGMVASIVTYLVILIQFMFAEKNRADHRSDTEQCS